MNIRIATRSSPLAQWQATEVARLLTSAHPGLQVDLVLVQTEMDRNLAVPIDQFGGKGAFCKAIQREVLEGRAEIAVHSAKDLESLTPPGLRLAAFPERGDVRDCLVGATPATLVAGSVVATGSGRRWALLNDLRSGLIRRELRGNIARRLSYLDRSNDPVDAIVVAAAALQRLGIEPEVVHFFDPETFVPQVGQGAMAIEARIDDTITNELLEFIDHGPTRVAVTAEREFLQELGADCNTPAGAYAIVDADAKILIRGVLHDGNRMARCEVVDTAHSEPGRLLARRLLAQKGD